MSRDKRLEKVHQLYCQAYEVCRRADLNSREYIGFQRQRAGGFRLVVSKSRHGGRSSARLGLLVPDWAENVLYRLQEESFIPADWPLDDYFDALQGRGGSDR